MGDRRVNCELEDVEQALGVIYPPRVTLYAFFQDSHGKPVPPAFSSFHTIPICISLGVDRSNKVPYDLEPCLFVRYYCTFEIPGREPISYKCATWSPEVFGVWKAQVKSAWDVNPGGTRGDGPCSVIEAIEGRGWIMPKRVEDALDRLTPEKARAAMMPKLKQALPSGWYTSTEEFSLYDSLHKINPPPSLDIPSSGYKVKHDFHIEVTCCDPMNRERRLVLQEKTLGFELLPAVLPALKDIDVLKLMRRHAMLRRGHHGRMTATGRGDIASLTKWWIMPSLPTTTFSPTATIPLLLKLAHPPPSTTPTTASGDTTVQAVYHISLVRREYSSLSTDTVEKDIDGNGLVQKEEVVSRWGWSEISSTSRAQISLPLPIIPPNTGNIWRFGYTTVADTCGMTRAVPVSPPAERRLPASFSSIFSVDVAVDFVECSAGGMESYLSGRFPLAHTPDRGGLTSPSSPWQRGHLDSAGFLKVFPRANTSISIEVAIGSVSERAGAVRKVEIVDSALDSEGTGVTVIKEVDSSENGWEVAPPTYLAALKEPAYKYEANIKYMRAPKDGCDDLGVVLT
ncbi:hypothetical protein IAT38_001986 [Cryptococcus sp. DSM 104549]